MNHRTSGRWAGQTDALFGSYLSNKREKSADQKPTDKTVNETAGSLQAAVLTNHFSVMQVHNLKESMVKKGIDFAHECLIFEVFQPKQAKKVLDENMSVSTALTCRKKLKP